MIRILIAAWVFLLVGCGGSGFAASGSAGSGGAPEAGAGGSASGGAPSGGAGAGGAPGAGAGGSAPSGGACSAFDASKPSLPARCQKVQQNQNSPCNAGDTCLTLEQAVTSSGPTEDLCQPTAIHTSCAACRETMTCACLAADFTFDKTGLESWKCCDTAAGPLYVTGYSCPR